MEMHPEFWIELQICTFLDIMAAIEFNSMKKNVDQAGVAWIFQFSENFQSLQLFSSLLISKSFFPEFIFARILALPV